MVARGHDSKSVLNTFEKTTQLSIKQVRAFSRESSKILPAIFNPCGPDVRKRMGKHIQLKRNSRAKDVVGDVLVA